MSVFTNIIAQADLPATAAASTVPETPLGAAPAAATVTEVSIIPEQTVTGATATARTMTIYNRTQSNLVVATLVSTTGNDWTANTKKLFTLSATAANLLVNAGDVLECVETIAGGGTIRPNSQVTVAGTHR